MVDIGGSIAAAVRCGSARDREPAGDSRADRLHAGGRASSRTHRSTSRTSTRTMPATISIRRVSRRHNALRSAPGSPATPGRST